MFLKNRSLFCFSPDPSFTKRREVALTALISLGLSFPPLGFPGLSFPGPIGKNCNPV